MINKISLIINMVFLVAFTFVGGYFYAKSQLNETVVTEANTPQVAGEQTGLAVSFDTIKDLWSKDLVKFGKGDKKLLVVEVSDPSCPYCHAASGVNKTIGSQIGQQFILKSEGGSYVAPVTEIKKLVDSGKADFVYIYSNGHGNGELATKALYCAFDQGKYWQAHQILMSDKGYDFINETVKNDMTKSGEMANFLASAVDKNKLKSCLDEGKYDARIAEENKLARSLGVEGTPGFFLNDQNFAGAYSWTEMESVANAALK